MLAILGNLNHKSPGLLLKQILLDIKDTAVDELSAERYVKLCMYWYNYVILQQI